MKDENNSSLHFPLPANVAIPLLSTQDSTLSTSDSASCLLPLASSLIVYECSSWTNQSAGTSLPRPCALAR
jgi:hypothetical protein